MSLGLAILSKCLPRSTTARAFSQVASALEKALPPRRKIDENEIIENFVKGTGPGGQKINKTSCAVQIKHVPTGVVVKSQETRSRQQNRKYARMLLAEKLDELENGAESRTAIKTERARTKKASADKKARRKYKKIDEAKRAAQDGTLDEAPEGDAVEPKEQIKG